MSWAKVGIACEVTQDQVASLMKVLKAFHGLQKPCPEFYVTFRLRVSDSMTVECSSFEEMCASLCAYFAAITPVSPPPDAGARNAVPSSEGSVSASAGASTSTAPGGAEGEG